MVIFHYHFSAEGNLYVEVKLAGNNKQRDSDAWTKYRCEIELRKALNWNLVFEKWLLMSRKMYLSARFRGDVPSGDTLRIPEKYRKYRYANISQLFQGFKNADMLEIFQALC